MKGKRILIKLLAAASVLLILWVGDLFLGNPISRYRAENHARRYLDKVYPAELQLQIADVYHDWYSGGGYDIRVTSPVSVDTKFTLHYDRLGRLVQNTYDMTVASGNATLSRLMGEYDGAVASVLGEFLETHDYKAGLSCIDGYSGQPVPLETGIDPGALTLDGVYDVAELGREYGYISLTIGVEREAVTVETAAELLLRIRAALAEKGIGWRQLDLFLSEENGKNADIFVGINGIREDDLNREDVLEHLTAMRNDQLSWWLGPKEE